MCGYNWWFMIDLGGKIELPIAGHYYLANEPGTTSPDFDLEVGIQSLKMNLWTWYSIGYIVSGSEHLLRNWGPGDSISCQMINDVRRVRENVCNHFGRRAIRFCSHPLKNLLNAHGLQATEQAAQCPPYLFMTWWLYIHVLKFFRSSSNPSTRARSAIKTICF